MLMFGLVWFGLYLPTLGLSLMTMSREVPANRGVFAVLALYEYGEE